jgi:hypothetical protein
VSKQWRTLLGRALDVTLAKLARLRERAWAPPPASEPADRSWLAPIRAGRLAARAGLSLEENPYYPGAPEQWAAWDYGWGVERTVMDHELIAEGLRDRLRTVERQRDRLAESVKEPSL